MIDPNASRRPGKMNIAKMLDYVRQNPMAMGGGGMKNPMQRPGMPQPGMPPLRPMTMMARAGGFDPMGPQEPGVNYGGAPTPNPPGTGPTHGGTTYGPANGPPNGYSAPTPDLPDRPGITPIGQYGVFDPFGPAPTANAYAVGGIARPGAFTYDPVAPATAMAATVGKRGIDDARGIARGMGVGVNAAGQATGGPEPGSDPFGYGGFANNGYGSMGYGVTPGSFAGYDAVGNAVSAGSAQDVQGGYAGGAGGAAGGTGKIVCTAMNQDYGFGSFRQAIWLRHSANLHPAYERGYHAMFRPLLAYGRKRSTLAQRVVMAALEDIARMRTFDIRREARTGFWRGLNRGRLYRAVLEPLCFVVGLMNAGR